MRIEATKLWKQAENELEVSEALIKAFQYAAASFHAQQAAEMALKAVNVEQTGLLSSEHKLFDLARRLGAPESVFRAAARGDEPVLDVGAGTGLIGQAMAGGEIDALDLSPEMLAVARRKGVYRDLIAADLTGPLALPDGAYGGVVSAGTFTHGHVGPACLPELLRITRPGALFVCTVVPEVYDSAGFGSSLALLVAQGRITPVRFDDFAIYDHADDAHADARGLIMTFRRL